MRQKGQDKEQLDKDVIEAVSKTNFAKDGNYFVVEIESPLVLAHLKNTLRTLGHISDSSFNASIVRMPLDAATDLIKSFIPENNQEDIKNALIAAGAPDGSIKGVLKSSFKKLGKKVIGDAVDGVADNISDFMSPIIAGVSENVTELWNGVFDDDENNEG